MIPFDLDPTLLEKRGLILVTSSDERDVLPIDDQVRVALQRTIGWAYDELSEEEQSLVRSRFRIYDVYCPHDKCTEKVRMYVKWEDEDPWYCDQHAS